LVAISPTGSTALALLQQTQRQNFRSPFALFEAKFSSVVEAGDVTGAQVLDVFADNPAFQKQFVEEYERLRKEVPGITSANAAHNATVEVILKNREHFPDEGFAIHTKFPGGGEVWSLIPPSSGHSPAFAELERSIGITAANRAIEAQIAEALTRAQESNVEPPDPQEIRERLGALYLARWS